MICGTAAGPPAVHAPHESDQHDCTPFGRIRACFSHRVHKQHDSACLPLVLCTACISRGSRAADGRKVGHSSRDGGLALRLAGLTISHTHEAHAAERLTLTTDRYGGQTAPGIGVR
jgi:hypothetical protein